VQKRSQAVLIGLLGLPGAAIVAGELLPGGPVMTRNVYADRAACERDYSPAQCSPGGGTGGSSYGMFLGPSYSADRSAPAARGDPGPGRVGGLATATVTSARGGFGGFARGAHAGG
jgi:hypothetical protein